MPQTKTELENEILTNAVLQILKITENALRMLEAVDNHPSTKRAQTITAENGRVYELRRDGDTWKADK